MKRGLLIALEGIEASGTTTQSLCLQQALRDVGRSVHVTKEPTQNSVGRLLRKMLKADNEEKPRAELMALLFATDRLQHCQEEILPALLSGQDVVTDRYVLSSLVYQGLHLPPFFLGEINTYALKPDVTVILD